MTFIDTPRPQPLRVRTRLAKPFPMAVALVVLSACSGQPAVVPPAARPMPVRPTPLRVTPPSPDPRVGLTAGLFDAAEATWNLRVVSSTPPAEPFVGSTNSDMAFKGDYAIQGNYNGVQFWNIEDPSNPASTTTFVCPASQNDVSVYQNLLFVSGEGMGGRLDCGTQGVDEAVSADRLRGIRIFDISDIRSPRYITNVQTCRGSHTHTLLVAPSDPNNVYIYVSGSAPVRSAEELAGCSGAMPSEDPNTALFRIEVIRVPLDHPEQAAIVSSPRIFEELVAPPTHGMAPEDEAALQEARDRGAFIAEFDGQFQIMPDQFAEQMLADMLAAQGRTGPPTAADSTALREMIPAMLAEQFGPQSDEDGPGFGPTQCHDITVYPAMGLAGGACEGYGLLLDISDPLDPKRLAAVADSNFAYWHSATFNNAATKILFTDEWGGGGGPKCRATDPKEWGANAIFTIEGREMVFRSYYKLPAPQTSLENCVAHNGSLIPIPGRDVMVQAWYQGGISVFDWTDASRPVEIAFHDRGPSDPSTMGPGGSWSVYWYNGAIVSSEIARGLDIFELTPSEAISQNEIDAANSVRLEYLNAQGQPRFVWPYTFALARAYLDQLERSRCMESTRIAEVRAALDDAERASTGAERRNTLTSLARGLSVDARASQEFPRVRMLAEAVRGLAGS